MKRTGRGNQERGVIMNYEYVVYLYDKQGYTIDIVYIADRAHAIKYAKNHSRYDRKTVIIDDFANEIIATYRNGKKVGDSK